MLTAVFGCCRCRCSQDKANLERQLKQLNSKSTLLEKNLEKKDAQVSSLDAFTFALWLCQGCIACARWRPCKHASAGI
jgi:hypothetical protein